MELTDKQLYSKEYYLKNKEKLQTYLKTYYQNNKNKYNNTYTKEERNEYYKKYKDYHKSYYQRNREKLLAYQNEYNNIHRNKNNQNTNPVTKFSVKKCNSILNKRNAVKKQLEKTQKKVDDFKKFLKSTESETTESSELK